ncbi:uncharacterized protein EI90DRAFT_3063837 [Cantharellus anzutake]|uniref:uncharacterized protein n=1 Tax=Cantharellus anzutake TaxID=1750568 RepID=UPI0019062871|nr:uncharacterized protein EI90DRAFT_3063837 [Cantharellus anzutake]KAF8328869.1 hypothetical protein EI90DRAFT_3063837 [Cantharellus anzutake]
MSQGNSLGQIGSEFDKLQRCMLFGGDETSWKTTSGCCEKRIYVTRDRINMIRLGGRRWVLGWFLNGCYRRMEPDLSEGVKLRAIKILKGHLIKSRQEKLGHSKQVFSGTACVCIQEKPVHEGHQRPFLGRKRRESSVIEANGLTVLANTTGKLVAFLFANRLEYQGEVTVAGHDQY